MNLCGVVFSLLRPVVFPVDRPSQLGALLVVMMMAFYLALPPISSCERLAKWPYLCEWGRLMHSSLQRAHREQVAPGKISQRTLVFWHARHATLRSFDFLKKRSPWRPRSLRACGDDCRSTGKVS